MSQTDRAKQFMPFAALKGYEEALRKKEKIVVKYDEGKNATGQSLTKNIMYLQD